MVCSKRLFLCGAARDDEDATPHRVDAVELHLANGYLPDQYGGLLENRCRFVLELVEAVPARQVLARMVCKICPLFSGVILLRAALSAQEANPDLAAKLKKDETPVPFEDAMRATLV